MGQGQLQTERGLIYVEQEVKTKDEATKLGYTYSFHSSLANASCFSKITGENRRIFCIVKD